MHAQSHREEEGRERERVTEERMKQEIRARNQEPENTG